MAAPKKLKARYHRVVLKNGYILEIGWSNKQKKYRVIYHKPVTDMDLWDQATQIYGESVKEVLSIARREFAELANPEIKAVRERVSGKTDVPDWGKWGESIAETMVKQRIKGDFQPWCAMAVNGEISKITKGGNLATLALPLPSLGKKIMK